MRLCYGAVGNLPSRMTITQQIVPVTAAKTDRTMTNGRASLADAGGGQQNLADSWRILAVRK